MLINIIVINYQFHTVIQWQDSAIVFPPPSLPLFIYLRPSFVTFHFSLPRLSVPRCDWLDYNESRFYHVSSSLGEVGEGSNKSCLHRLLATTESCSHPPPWMPLSPSCKVAAGNKLATQLLHYVDFVLEPPLTPLSSTSLPPSTQLFVTLPAEQSEGPLSVMFRHIKAEITTGAQAGVCGSFTTPLFFFHQTNEKATLEQAEDILSRWTPTARFLQHSEMCDWKREQLLQGVMAVGRFANIKRNI